MVDAEANLEAVLGEAAHPGHARVVDQHVQRFPPVQELRRAPADRGQVGQVQREEHDRVVPGGGADLGGGGTALLRRTAGHEDLAAPAGEVSGRGAADPGVGPGNQEGAAGQVGRVRWHGDFVPRRANGVTADAGFGQQRYARPIAGGSGHGPAFAGGPGADRGRRPAARAAGHRRGSRRRRAGRRRAPVRAPPPDVDHSRRGRGAAHRPERLRGVRARPGGQRERGREPAAVRHPGEHLHQPREPDAAVPGARAPGFTLTDQNGRTMSLASLRGKVVVLEFMDPHCTDICPIVSQEFVDAYHQLGPRAGKVVFAAVNVNQYHATVADMAAFTGAQRLNTIPSWHFFTGPVPALETVWRAYDIAVEAPSPNADIIHTSSVYFIDAQGRERFVASPMVDHTASGASYLPLAQISAWADGIAGLAKD